MDIPEVKRNKLCVYIYIILDAYRIQYRKQQFFLLVWLKSKVTVKVHLLEKLCSSKIHYKGVVLKWIHTFENLLLSRWRRLGTQEMAPMQTLEWVLTQKETKDLLTLEAKNKKKIPKRQNSMKLQTVCKHWETRNNAVPKAVQDSSTQNSSKQRGRNSGQYIYIQGLIN